MSIVVLTGGVGGAKLVLGLTRIVPPETITAIVNTGDDFRLLSLPISPDLDTLLYTLSDKAHRVQGWGREGESWAFMDAVRSLGGPDWFALGDGDLALHVLRNHMLAAGKTLSDVTSIFGRAWGVTTAMLPMTDDPVATIVDTDEGPLSFQDYFVARRCVPAVRAVRFEGAGQARPAPGVLNAITSPEAEAIFIAPSNPFLSVDPILSVPGIADALRMASAPVVAISPIVGGASVKGPTDKIMRELGIAVTPVTIAAHYGDWMDAMLVDERDHKTPPDCVHDLADTLMKTIDDRERVARAALNLAQKVGLIEAAMTGWTALVPIKPSEMRKTRLLGMTEAQRVAVTERMLEHVLAILAMHTAVEQTVILAAHATPGFGHMRDEGRGLNAELDAARLTLPGDILVIHADLPLLASEDITALITGAAQNGAALAPDRHGTGTNAIALRAGVDWRFRFGPDSRHRHGEAFPAVAILDRRGLALDVDTLSDLHLSGLMLRPDAHASVRVPHQDL